MERGHTAHQVDRFERHGGLLCLSAQVGLFKSLSPYSVGYHLDNSTAASLAGMHQWFLNVMKSPLPVTHHSSLQRAGFVPWDGRPLEQEERFQKRQIPERTKQANHTNHTNDDQSVFLPTPSPQTLENQLMNAPGISRVKTESVRLGT